MMVLKDSKKAEKSALESQSHSEEWDWKSKETKKEIDDWMAERNVDKKVMKVRILIFFKASISPYFNN